MDVHIDMLLRTDRVPVIQAAAGTTITSAALDTVWVCGPRGEEPLQLMQWKRSWVNLFLNQRKRRPVSSRGPLAIIVFLQLRLRYG